MSGGKATLTTRNLAAAQEAFSTKNKENLKKSHSGIPAAPSPIYEPAHKSATIKEALKAYGRPIISGGTYSVFVVGLLASIFFAAEQSLYFFALTSAIFGAMGTVFIGTQDYLNQLYDIEMIKWERKRETWEYDNYLEGEQREMIELFQQKGMAKEDAELTIRTMSKYKELFVDVMMVQELGLLMPDWTPLQHALGIAGSFFAGSFLPILPVLGYCLVECDNRFPYALFKFTIVRLLLFYILAPLVYFSFNQSLCLVYLCGLGFLRSHFLEGHRWWKPLFAKVLNFLLGCGLAFFVSGRFRSHWQAAVLQAAHLTP